MWFFKCSERLWPYDKKPIFDSFSQTTHLLVSLNHPLGVKQSSVNWVGDIRLAGTWDRVTVSLKQELLETLPSKIPALYNPNPCCPRRCFSSSETSSCWSYTCSFYLSYLIEEMHKKKMPLVPWKEMFSVAVHTVFRNTSVSMPGSLAYLNSTFLSTSKRNACKKRFVFWVTGCVIRIET